MSSRKKKTKQEVADIVMSEGLGYAIQHYLPSTDIEDEELRMWWNKAENALDKVRNLLDDYLV